MTQREFYNSVINAEISEEMTTFARERIAVLDKRNHTPSKADKEKAEQNGLHKAKMIGVLRASETAMPASEIAAAVEISTQKASALLRQLVADGQAVQSEIKVKGRGKVKAYALATVETESEIDE